MGLISRVSSRTYSIKMDQSQQYIHHNILQYHTLFTSLTTQLQNFKKFRRKIINFTNTQHITISILKQKLHSANENISKNEQKITKLENENSNNNNRICWGW